MLKSADAVTTSPERLVPAWYWVTKRLTDVVGSGLLLVCFAPIIALAALAIVCTTGGAPFFTQERVGRNGKRFRLFKLRTMVPGAHAMRTDLLHLNEADGPVFKIRNDPRIHPLGRFLRTSSLDELPNLLNVFVGDMSLVGPRPPLPDETVHYSEYARRRLLIKPGITCLWQIQGRCNLSFDQWMQLDNLYIDTWTPLGDFLILLRTIPAVLRREGAR